MSRWWVWPILGFGILLMLTGLTLCGALVSPPGWKCILLGTGVMSLLTVRRRLRAWRQENFLRTNNSPLSATAEKLTPDLWGEYSPYVIEAAEKLAEERDTTAVPALLTALQRCVDQQRPGWSEVAEALVKALARIGDRRALALLYRLENVRGIGIIPSIREAIAAIEPQTSLLRPVSAEGSLPETLLRPAQGVTPSENDAVLLLRPSKD
ncbi:MAG TPA: HEAT repeat domain-containing protein [Chthonomonadaceae bacterium]|nr:HEAT repeat domain-containing protein [Chthonomonadaceae bacterium]